MTKEKFTKLMKELISIKKDEDNLNEAFKKFEPDFNYISFGSYENLCVNTLRDAMDDEADWIGYWLYDLEFGTKAKKTSVKKDGKNVPIKTLSNLYDCIVNK